MDDTLSRAWVAMIWRGWARFHTPPELATWSGPSKPTAPSSATSRRISSPFGGGGAYVTVPPVTFKLRTRSGCLSVGSLAVLGTG